MRKPKIRRSPEPVIETKKTVTKTSKSVAPKEVANPVVPDYGKEYALDVRWAEYNKLVKEEAEEEAEILKREIQQYWSVK
jgi:hypothetical protein